MSESREKEVLERFRPLFEPRGVIASASDCASFGPGAVDACAQAIERAVAQHETTAAHNNLETCESAVGQGTRFALTLPLASRATGASRAAQVQA